MKAKKSTLDINRNNSQDTPHSTPDTYPELLKKWLAPHAEISGGGDRVLKYLKTVTKCGSARAGNLNVLGVGVTAGKLHLQNGRSCKDRACVYCSQVTGAKRLEETRQVIEKAHADGIKIYYCVLTKASPRFFWRTKLRAAKTKRQRRGVLKAWQQWIKWSVEVDDLRAQEVAKYLSTKPYGLEYARFTEVVFAVNYADGEEDEGTHAHVHTNFLFLFPSNIPPDDVARFWETLIKVNKDAVDAARKSLLNSHKKTFKDYSDAMGATKPAAQFIEEIDIKSGQRIATYLNKGTFEARGGREDDSLSLAATLRKNAGNAAAELSSAVTKTSKNDRAVTLNQFALTELMHSDDQALYYWGGATLAGWLRASNKKRMMDWSRSATSRKRLPTVWGCKTSSRERRLEVISGYHAGPSESQQDRKYFRRTSLEKLQSLSYRDLSPEDAALYVRAEKLEEQFLRSVGQGKKRIYQLEAYRAGRFKAARCEWDQSLSEVCRKQIRQFKRVVEFPPGVKKHLALSVPADEMACGRNIESFVYFVIHAAVRFDSHPDVQRKRFLDGRYGGNPMSLLTLVTSKRAWKKGLWLRVRDAIGRVIQGLEVVGKDEILKRFEIKTDI
jgi:hypothetical protein